jgi:hypothetical protein
LEEVRNTAGTGKNIQSGTLNGKWKEEYRGRRGEYKNNGNLMQ